MSEKKPAQRWTPRQLRMFAGVIVAGLVAAVAITALLAAVTGLGAPRATFVGVVVAVVAMYAALAVIGIRERRSR